MSDKEWVSFQSIHFVRIHVFTVNVLSFFFPPPIPYLHSTQSSCLVKALEYHHRYLWRKFFHLFLTPHQGSLPMFWLICKPNIFLSLSWPSLSPPPHWCVRQGTQGRCLTEPWMLFSCHTFPKRLAAAPIVAAEGGLLGWFFEPPAVALVLDGFIERECGPNNGPRHDIMLLIWAKSSCRYRIGFRCMGQNREGIFLTCQEVDLASALLRCIANVFLLVLFLVFISTKTDFPLWNT